MELAQKDLDLLLKVANAAAIKAGKTISSYMDKHVEVQIKEGGESLASQVVTEVDLICQKVILEILEMTIIPYDLGLLTEESEDDKSRFEKDYFWCVDPLDGTLPFTEQTSGYSVSIALVSNSGEAVVGVIYDPFHNNTYSAQKDKGAYLNGEKWLVNPSPNRDVFTLVADRSFFKQDNHNAIFQKTKQAISDLGYSKLNVIKHGGAAMNAMWVIENAPAVYFKFPKVKVGGGSLWDYAASSCIFSELGLHVSDIKGNPLDLNRKDSTFMNHKGVVYSSDDWQRIAPMIHKDLFIS